jgi:cytochrome P450
MIEIVIVTNFTKETSMQEIPIQEQVLINGPKAAPLLGNLRGMYAKGPIKFYYGLWQEYGDVVELKLGPVPTFLFVRPEHIQHILVKNPDTYIKGMTLEKMRMVMGDGIFTLEGETWKQRRRLMQATYTPNGIRQFADLMSDVALKTHRHFFHPTKFPQSAAFALVCLWEMALVLTS